MLVLLIGLFSPLLVSAQVTRVVEQAGTDSGNCITSSCATIEYALGQAASGDTVEVGPGTYTESSGTSQTSQTNGLIILTDGITLRSSSGAENTIIDVNGATNAILIGDDAYNESTPTIHPDNVTVEGFTVQNWASRGIVQRRGTGTVHIRDNIVLKDSGTTTNAISISGGTGSTITGNLIESTSLNNEDWTGSGISLWGSINTLVENNTISGSDNGVLIIAHPGWTGTDPSWGSANGNIVRNNTISEVSNGVILQGNVIATLIEGNHLSDNDHGIEVADANTGAYPSDIQIVGNYIGFNGEGIIFFDPGNDPSPVVIENNTFEGNQSNLTDWLDLLDLNQIQSDNQFNSLLRLVAKDGADSGNCLEDACLTIQYAIGQAAPGDEVSIGVGRYSEQVIVNKSLGISGGPGVVIEAPANPDTYGITGSASTWRPIVLVYGGSVSGGVIEGAATVDVDITGIEIDGLDALHSGRYSAILYRNANGLIANNDIHSMSHLAGNETFGIMVYGDSTVVIEGNGIVGHGRGGIGVNGSQGVYPEPHATIVGNTVTGIGFGENQPWGANGIQIAWGATGSITGNVVTGSWHQNATVGGIYVGNGSNGVEIADNVLTGNGGGVLVSDADDTVVRGNIIASGTVGVWLSGGERTLIENNQIDQASSHGVLIDSMYGEIVDVIVQGNSFDLNGSAITTYDIDHPVSAVVVSGNAFFDNESQLSDNAGLLDENTFVSANAFDIDLALSIQPGLPTGLEAESGWAGYTAHLVSVGEVPENVALWLEVDGIDDSAYAQGLRVEYFNGSDWEPLGWGGVSHWQLNRDAYFLGRDENVVVGFPIEGGTDDLIPLRVNWPNSTYAVTASFESVDSGDGSGEPGERIWLTHSDTIVVESDPVDLSLNINEGLPAGMSEAEGYAHYTAILANDGGAVPENVVLWIEVDGIDNADVAGGATLEFYENGQWNSFGWAGQASWQLGRDAWFIGRDDNEVVGFEIPGNFTWPIPMRVNWDEGTYPLTVTIESTDGSAGPGEREYLNASPTIVVEQYVTPQLSIVPTSHDFGEVGELDSAVQAFTLSNDGSSATELTLGTIGITGSNAAAYQISGGSCSTSDVLAGGESCDVEVTFVPGMPGSYGDAQLSVASDANTVTADLTGAGILPDWADGFDGAFDEDGWQFFAFDGSPVLYTPATVQVVDDHLQINDPTALYAGGYIPRSFGESRVASLVNADGTNTGTSPDNQIDQGVLSHFDPELLEGYAAYLRYEHDYQDLVLLKFDAANFDPALIDERIRIAESSDDDWSMDRMYVVELDVVNQGGDALLVARAFDADSGALLATVEATDTTPFGPGYAGLAAITNSTGVNGTFDSASAVSSFASADLGTHSIDFGLQEVFSTSAAQSITVSNRGNVDLDISALEVVGADAADFGIQNSDCADPIAAGDSCSFELAFTPGAAQPRAAEVVIESNASTTPDAVLLEGEGTPATATVSLSDLIQVYDGDPKSATVTTDPAGLNVVVTYDSSATQPVDAGSYAVEAVIDEPDYSGSASDTLVIEAADQSIDFPAIADRSVDDSPFTISATADSGLAVNFSVVSGPANVSGNEVTLDGVPGTVTIEAAQTGDGNWNAAPTMQQSFQVTEGNAASIEAVSATTISGQAGQPVAAGDLPTVRVIDSQDNPVSGITVSFSVASGGGSVTGATQVTDANGQAQVGGWTLGGDATQTLEAAAPGLAGSAVVFTANADADYQFTVSVDDGRESIEVGERNSYVIVVSNNGNSNAVGAQVTGLIPPELDAASADWYCVPGGSAASCAGTGTGDLTDTADLPAGASVVYILEAEVIGGSGGSIDMEVSVDLDGVTGSGADSTNVAITEDAIFSDRFETVQSGNSVRFDSAREQASAWLQFSNGLRGGLPPRVVLKGLDAGGSDVFRVRALRTPGQLLVQLSIRDGNGNWQRSAWQPVTATERLLAVDYDASIGGLLVAGERFEASLLAETVTSRVQRLVVAKGITLQVDD